MKLSEVFGSAATLLAKTEAWAKGCYARDEEDTEVDLRSEHARSWCTVGAFFRHVHWTEDKTRQAGLRLMAKHCWPFQNISRWNDAVGRKHSDVLALLRGCEVEALAQEGAT